MKKLKTNKPLNELIAFDLWRFIKDATGLEPDQYSLGIGCTEHLIPGEVFRDVKQFLTKLGYINTMPARADGKKRIQEKHKALVLSPKEEEEFKKAMEELDKVFNQTLNEMLKDEARKPRKETNKVEKHCYELMEADLPIKENKFITIKIDKTKFTKDQLEMLFAMIDGANRLGKTNE